MPEEVIEAMKSLMKNQQSKPSIMQDHAGWVREIYLKEALKEWWAIVEKL